MANESEITTSVILAIRNEEEYIGKCLESLIHQSFSEKYEIIIADGISTDKTRQIIESLRQKHPLLIRILDNPDHIQSSGRNLGINAAQGKFVLIFDGHAAAEHQFIHVLISQLRAEPDFVAGAGGIHLPPDDENFIGKLIGYVQMSFLGGAGTSYRNKKEKSYVDSLAFTAYKKSVLQQVGLYDTRFLVGEDFDLNWRIRKAGFKLAVCPKAIVYYYRRHSSFLKFIARMFSYGVWRAIVTKKHPSSFRFFLLLPVLLVICLITAPFLLTLFWPVGMAETILIALYLALTVISSVKLTICKRDIRYLGAFAIYLIEHCCIGFGFLLGTLKRIPKPRSMFNA